MSFNTTLMNMQNKSMTTCEKCGCDCEHGWDAHTVITTNGVVILCDTCY